MKKRIIITETQLRYLLEKKDKEFFFNDFKDDVLKFIKDLLSNPANASVSDKLKDHNINRKKLIDALIKKGLLTRKQKVTEVENSKGKKESRMVTVYSANTDDATDKLEKIYKSFDLGKLYSESTNPESVMEEEPLYEIEMDEMDEAMAAGASNGAGGTWMNGSEYTVPVFGDDEDCKKHDNLVRRSLPEAKDRSQYWKDRWAKQKAEGSIPDRSEYWKERAKKQRAERPKRNRPQPFTRDDEEDIWSQLNDNDFGEYFGDHD